MFYLKKRMEVAGSHCLNLDYESKCSSMHGHNWIIIVYCKARVLNHNGMVTDFADIKKVVMRLDHKNLNDLFDFNTTAENLSEWLQGQIPNCYKVTVIESENNEATYEEDYFSMEPVGV